MSGSAGRPWPELVRVAHRPDAPDPVAGDVEREHRDGGPVNLRDQAGLAVDRSLQERRVSGRPLGEFDPGARDLLAAFDGTKRRARSGSCPRVAGGLGHSAKLDHSRATETQSPNATGSVTLGDGTAYDDLPLVIVNELIP
jgi:hypothetical protein